VGCISLVGRVTMISGPSSQCTGSYLSLVADFINEEDNFPVDAIIVVEGRI